MTLDKIEKMLKEIYDIFSKCNAIASYNSSKYFSFDNYDLTDFLVLISYYRLLRNTEFKDRVINVIIDMDTWGYDIIRKNYLGRHYSEVSHGYHYIATLQAYSIPYLGKLPNYIVELDEFFIHHAVTRFAINAYSINAMLKLKNWNI